MLTYVYFHFSVHLTRVSQRTNNTIVGVVQLFKSNRWNYVCGDFFDNIDAGVVCRKMGYGYYRALPAGALGRIYFYRNVAGGINCTGTESSLGKCPLQMGGCNNRNYLNYGSVICSKVPIPQGELVKESVFEAKFVSSLWENLVDVDSGLLKLKENSLSFFN